MNRRYLIGIVMASIVALSAPVYAEPSLHEVYQAAQSGRMTDARKMMDEVLKAHPNSAKAHYVEAELLAKQRDFSRAQAELQTAERLAPGLPFAKAEAVQELRALVTRTQPSTQSIPTIEGSRRIQAVDSGDSSFPWMLVIVGAGLLVFIVLVSRYMGRRNASAMQGSGAYGVGGYGNGYSASPAAPSWGGMPGAGGVAPTGGLGTGILGGLATGAAVGAGVVAGEALMHRILDGERHDANAVVENPRGVGGMGGVGNLGDIGAPLRDFSNNEMQDDMGGLDFGVSDGTSWDDGGSSNDSNDWL